MPTQKIKLGTKGFNADLPPYALPPDYFNDGQNMRFKDGSMQACVKAQTLTGYSLTVSGAAVQPLRNTQYTPFGTTFLNSVVTGLTSSNQLATRYVENGTTVSVALAAGDHTYNQSYGIDSFIFNGIHILNTKNMQPMYYNANDTTFGTSYKVLPDWIMTNPVLTPFTGVVVSGGYANFGSSSISAFITVGSYIGSLDTSGNPNPIYRVSAIVGNVATLEGDTPTTTWSTVYVAYPYMARGMTSFENRLIAFNLVVNLPSGVSGDNFSPIELAWSNPITNIASLNSVVWSVSATNTAGYDYITQTPGEILAAEVLGEYLMVYKNDSVHKFIDAGAPNYIIGQQIYNYDGAMNARSVVNLGDTRHLVVGNRSVYITQGGIDANNISRGVVEEYLYKGPSGIDLNYIGINFCYHDIQEKEVWFCYRSKQAPAVTGGVAGCDKALCYQYITGNWYPRTLNNVLDINDYQVGSLVYSIISAPALTSTLPTTLSYFPYPSETASGIFESECSAYWDQRDLGTAQIVKTVNGVYPHSLQPSYIQIYFKNQITDRDSTQPLRYFDPSSSYKLDYRITGRYLYMALIGDATGTSNSSSSPYLCDIDLDTEGRGRR